jgi:endonuclease G
MNMARVSRLVLLLAFAAAASSVRGDYVQASGEAEVQASPSRDAEVLATAPAGTAMALLEDEQTAGYYHVEWPGRDEGAWVCRKFVRRYPGTVPEAARSGAPEADRPRAADHLAIGQPIAVHQRTREGYVAAVDARLKIPVWVQYELSSEDLDGEAEREGRGFRQDRTLPALARAKDSDYLHSGYARGHLAPAEDMTRSEEVMADSFYFSNCAPQEGPRFNGAIWAQLEAAVRDWVEQRGRLTVITGPIFQPEPLERPDGTGPTGRVTYLVIGSGQVAVPTHFFKIVVDTTVPDEPEAMAFIMPNTDLVGHTYDEYLRTIRQVEQATGLDFLSALPDRLESRVETAMPDQPWPLLRQLDE